MIEGASTVGYSSSTTAKSISGKYLGSFPGFSQRSDHHIVGTGSATTNTSSLPTSRMHLVDSWRESIMKHSYEKQVSVFSSLYVITKDDIEYTSWMQYKIQWILIFLHIAFYIVMSIKPFRKIVFEVFFGNCTICSFMRSNTLPISFN